MSVGVPAGLPAGAAPVRLPVGGRRLVSARRSGRKMCGKNIPWGRPRVMFRPKPFGRKMGAEKLSDAGLGAFF